VKNSPSSLPTSSRRPLPSKCVCVCIITTCTYYSTYKPKCYTPSCSYIFEFIYSNKFNYSVFYSNSQTCTTYISLIFIQNMINNTINKHTQHVHTRSCTQVIHIEINYQTFSDYATYYMQSYINNYTDH